MFKTGNFKMRFFAAPALLALALTACGSGADLSGTGGKEVLSFGSSNLAAAYQNEPYQADLTVSGGVNPYTLRVTSGELPPGVTLQGGQLVGTPTKQGRYEFIVEATDASLSTRAQTYAISVGNLPALSLTPSLPAGGGTFRADTRVPLTLSYPRAARAARFQWKLPAGVKVSRVEPGAAGGELLLWKQTGPLLTLDLAFTGPPQSGANVALIGLSFAKPVALDAGSSAFEARAMDGKLVAEKKFADAAKPAGPAAPTQNAAPGSAAPETKPGTTAPNTTTPDTATPSAVPAPAAPGSSDSGAPADNSTDTGTPPVNPPAGPPPSDGTPPGDGSSDVGTPPVNPPVGPPPDSGSGGTP